MTFSTKNHDRVPPSIHSHQERVGKRCGLEVHCAKTSTPADKAGSLSGGERVGGDEEKGAQTQKSCQTMNETNNLTILHSLKRYTFSSPLLLFRGRCLPFFHLLSPPSNLTGILAGIGQGCPVSFYGHQRFQHLTMLDYLWIKYMEEV